MKQKFKKSGKILGIVFGTLILLLILSTLVINLLFKDQLISYALHQLNKQLNTSVNVKKVDFSLWKKFPSASIEFTELQAFSSRNYQIGQMVHPDTLLATEKVYLDFNLFQLLQGIYHLERLYIKNGKLKIAIDDQGNANYDILKKSGNKSSGELNLDLENVVLENTYVDFIQEKSSVFIHGFAEKLNVKGKFKNKDFKLSVFGQVLIAGIQVHDEFYLQHKRCKVDFNLNVKDTHYSIVSSYSEIEKSKFLVEGDFELGKRQDMNLLVTGMNLNIKKVVHLLPDNVQIILKNYQSSGQADLKIKIYGPLDNSKINPTIDASFSINNGSCIEHSTGIKLHKISCQGYFCNQHHGNLNEAILKISNVSASLGTGFMSGKCEIKDFNTPSVNISLKSQIDLSEIKAFFKLDSLEVFKGNVESNLIIQGSMHYGPKFKLSDLSQLTYNGQISLHDVAVKLKHNDYSLNKINGVLIVDRDIHFNNLVVYLHNNDFKLNGILTNGISYFLQGPNNDCLLTAEVNSRNLDLTNYFVSASGNTNAKKSEYSRELLFPNNISLDVKLNVNRFKLHEFNAKWVSGNLFYKPRMFTLKSLSFESMTGHASGNGVILQDMNKNFITKGQLDLNHIDIHQMFFAFNNFSQIILRSEHLRGTLSGKTIFSTEWNNSLMLNQDKLLVEGDITINNGELVNFEPLLGLSRFVSVDELKNIKFSNLKNRIIIRDKMIIIPQMDVMTSAFNIKASGTHYFDNHYEYKVNVLLSDVLWGKAKRHKKQNEEFGIIEDDGAGKTTLPLSIIGKNSDFKIAYDSKQALDIAREKMSTQKTELKTILHQEFGWFKKDSTLKNNGNKTNKSAIRVSWDDDDAAPETKPSSSLKPKAVIPDKKKNEKINMEWDN